MFDSAKAVVSTALAIAAALFVFFIIGIITTPHATGMAAVGDGITAVFKGAVSLLSNIHF